VNDNAPWEGVKSIPSPNRLFKVAMESDLPSSTFI